MPPRLAVLLKLPRTLFLLAALLYAAWIFTLSSGNLPSISVPWLAYFVNLAHAPLFGLLAVLLGFAAWPRDAVRSLRVRMLLAWGGTLAYAITDEIHQSFTPGRTASVADVMTDTFGAAFALVLLRRLLRPDIAQAVWHYAGLVAAIVVSALVATIGG